MRKPVRPSWLVAFCAACFGQPFCTGEQPTKKTERPADELIQTVIDQVEKQCLDQTVCMIGRPKAQRLAELVRQARPRLAVECGTALGYSGLWIARELKKLGRGKLLTIEINPQTARRAEENFRRAGLEAFVTVKIGDARQVVKQIEGPVDFLFLDCGYSNYHPCFVALEKKLTPGAVVVADNVGIGAGGMGEYLKLVRQNYQSRTEWFDVNLPWAQRDAMEVTLIKPPGKREKREGG
ncbi:MAG: O-methyltransferase [Thermoguttaceae bacterium]